MCLNTSLPRIQARGEASQASVTKSRKQEEVHATDTPPSNASGVLIDKNEKADAILDIGAKWRVLGPLVNGDDVARLTRDGEIGETEAWAVGVACSAAGE